jgi:hypothetical protein
VNDTATAPAPPLPPLHGAEASRTGVYASKAEVLKDLEHIGSVQAAAIVVKLQQTNTATWADSLTPWH